VGSLHIYYCHLPCSLWCWKVCQWRWLCFVMLIFLFVFFPMQFGRRTFHKWKAVPYDPKYIHAEWLRINEKHQNRLKKQLIIEQNDNSQFTEQNGETEAAWPMPHWFMTIEDAKLASSTEMTVRLCCRVSNLGSFNQWFTIGDAEGNPKLYLLPELNLFSYITAKRRWMRV